MYFLAIQTQFAVFVMVTVARRYFSLVSLCLLVLVSVSDLFSPSVYLDDGHVLGESCSFGLPYVFLVF